jgi:NDP-sugar pyrophosphorylase family protein
VRRALPLLGDPFLVTYGDSYLPFDYAAPLRDLRGDPGALGTMAVFENEGRFDASNTGVSDGRVVRYEKGNVDPDLRFIDYGALALRAAAFASWPEGPFGLDALQRDLARGGKLRALVASERFFEIGSEAGLADLEARLAEVRS